MILGPAIAMRCLMPDQVQHFGLTNIGQPRIDHPAHAVHAERAGHYIPKTAGDGHAPNADGLNDEAACVGMVIFGRRQDNAGTKLGASREKEDHGEDCAGHAVAQVCGDSAKATREIYPFRNEAPEPVDPSIAPVEDAGAPLTRAAEAATPFVVTVS